MEASNTNRTSSIGEAFIWEGASIRSLFYGMWKGRHFLFSVKNSSYEDKGTQDTPGYRFFRFFSRKLENNSLALQKSGADLGGAGDAPPPFQDDLRLSNTTGIEQKKSVVYWSWSKTWDVVEEFMFNAVKMVKV